MCALAVLMCFGCGISFMEQTASFSNLCTAPDSEATSAVLQQACSEYLSSPKPGHTPGGSVRGGARRDGGAGRGRAAQDVDGTARLGENSSSYPPDDGRMTSWVCLLEARTKETLCKPNAGTKSPVDPRFIRGLSAGREALFVPGC